MERCLQGACLAYACQDPLLQSLSLSLQRGVAAHVVVCKSPLSILACYKTEMKVPDVLEQFVRFSPLKKKKKNHILFWATSSTSFLFFQLVGIILACCLSQYITNNQYEMV